MKCHECLEQLSAYRDHMLTPEKQKEIEMHLKTCSCCNEEMQLLTKILNELNTMQEDEVPEIVHRSIMKRIYKDKEEIRKRKALKTWMSYIASTVAVLLIVVVLLDGNEMINYKKSNSLNAESAPSAASQDNAAFSDEPIMAQSKMAETEDQKDKEMQPFMYRAETGEMPRENAEAVAEIWEITTLEKSKVIERIREYSETYELLVQYLPDEVNPTTIKLYGIRNKNELSQVITEIDSDIIISKEELEGDNLEIIIK